VVSGQAGEPGGLGDRPAVRPHPRRQRGQVPERDLNAAALRQHPPQNHPDLRIHARRARPDIISGLRGRVALARFHKAGSASRPPRITGVHFLPGPGSITHRDLARHGANHIAQST